MYKTLILLATLVATPLPAADAWQKQLELTATTLRASDYAKASTIVDHAIAEMVDHLGSGDAEARMFGTALLYKAIASAGQGNVEDAQWYWNLAQETSPAVAKTDLSSFGAAGEYLTLHPPVQAEVSRSMTSLKVVKEVAPKFPHGASRFGIAGDLVVQIIVDREGRPTFPRVVHPLPAPTLSFVALEALRHWRFQPATRNGETVPSLFNLTVHYKL